MVQETRIRKSGYGESSPRYLLFLVLVMTLMIALLECLSYTSLYSKDIVIGDTFGLVLRDRSGNLSFWSGLQRVGLYFLLYNEQKKMNPAPNDNKVERAK